MVSTNIDKKNIISLWNATFGDTEDEIKYFLDNCNDTQCIGVYDGERLVSMLFLVRCTVAGESGSYIYAACTDTDYRKKGYMTELLDYAKQSFNRLCLIPAQEWLVDYYKKREFRFALDLEEIHFNQTQEITEYLFDGCELKQPIALVYMGE